MYARLPRTRIGGQAAASLASSPVAGARTSTSAAGMRRPLAIPFAKGWARDEGAVVRAVRASLALEHDDRIVQEVECSGGSGLQWWPHSIRLVVKDFARGGHAGLREVASSIVTTSHEPREGLLVQVADNAARHQRMNRAGMAIHPDEILAGRTVLNGSIPPAIERIPMRAEPHYIPAFAIESSFAVEYTGSLYCSNESPYAQYPEPSGANKFRQWTQEELVAGPLGVTDFVYAGFNFRTKYVNSLIGRLQSEALIRAAQPLEPTMMPEQCLLHPFESKPSFAGLEATQGEAAQRRARLTALAHLMHGTEGVQFANTDSDNGNYGRPVSIRHDRRHVDPNSCAFSVKRYSLAADFEQSQLSTDIGALLLPVWVCEYQLGEQSFAAPRTYRAFVWGGEPEALKPWGGKEPASSTNVWRKRKEAYAAAYRSTYLGSLRANKESAAAQKKRIEGSASYAFLANMAADVAAGQQHANQTGGSAPALPNTPKRVVQHVQAGEHTDPALSAIKATFWATILPVLWGDSMLLLAHSAARQSSVLDGLAWVLPVDCTLAAFGLAATYGASLWVSNDTAKSAWDRAKASTESERLANEAKATEERWQASLKRFGPTDPGSYLERQHHVAIAAFAAYPAPVWQYGPSGAGRSTESGDNAWRVLYSQRWTRFRALFEYAMLLAVVLGIHWVCDGPFYVDKNQATAPTPAPTPGPTPAPTPGPRPAPAPTSAPTRAPTPTPQQRAPPKSAPAPAARKAKVPSGGGFPEDF